MMAEETITITLDREFADTLSSGLSDLLCWAAGFNAALSPSEDHDRRPMGIHAAREINIKLKSALDRDAKQGMPF